MKYNTRSLIKTGASTACLLLFLLPMQTKAQVDRSGLVKSLVVIERVLFGTTAKIDLDDPYEVSVKEDPRDRIAGRYDFACTLEATRLERRFQETSRSGATYTVLDGNLSHSGVLYYYSLVDDDSKIPFTTRVSKGDIPFPNPAMAVRIAGSSYRSWIEDGRNVKVSDFGQSAVVKGTYDGYPFSLTFIQKSGQWVPTEVTRKVEKNGTEFFVYARLPEWKLSEGGALLPASIKYFTGDGKTSDESKARTARVTEWAKLSESIEPQSRVRPNSLVLDESGGTFLFDAAKGGLTRTIVAPSRPSNPWTLLYFLSGTTLVVSTGLLVVHFVRQRRGTG